jgi:hypothetical protein
MVKSTRGFMSLRRSDLDSRGESGGRGNTKDGQRNQCILNLIGISAVCFALIVDPGEIDCKSARQVYQSIQEKTRDACNV